MQFRNAYTAIIRNDSLYDETFGESRIEKELKLSFRKDSLITEKSIQLVSAGMDHGDVSEIKLDKTNYSMNHRGLNVVILDGSGNVKISTFFDTFQECFHRTETDNIFEVWLIE